MKIGNIENNVKDKGITLIALIITIIIMLILAAVVINLVISKNGIINIAKQAGRNYQNAQITEGESLNELEEQIANYDNSFNTTGTINTETKEEIPEGYIKPSGTIAITEKSDKIDVSNYQYADTMGLYTKEEAQSGEGVYWHKVTQTFPTSGNTMTVNLGYVPSLIFINATDKTDYSYRYWSLDGQTFEAYCIRSDGTLVAIDKSKISNFKLDNDNFIMTVKNPDNWNGVNIDIYAMK